MPNKSLTVILDELVSADKVRLPVYPPVIRQVNELLRQTEQSCEQLSRLASRDPALVCNLFRAANSSFFEGLPKTSTLEEAITRLGPEKAAQVISRACHEGEGCPGGELLPRYLPNLWKHAVGCALGARWLGVRCGYQPLATKAYLAGLLHDIGKLYLIAALDNATACGDFELSLSTQIVGEVVDTMHVEQGIRLFVDWNLPEIYQKVIDDHHGEALDPQDIIVSLVKLANKACRKIGLGLDQDANLVLPTTAEAQFLGIDEIALAEYEIMLEDQFLATTTVA